YRSGFEIRTYRLCRRALMFHRFPAELGVDSYLVRSTDFEYTEKPTGSFVTRVVQSGYRRQDDGRYLKRNMPPLDFTYTASLLDDPDCQDFVAREVDADSLANLHGGIEADYHWVDLDGEGIGGVLTEQAGEWFFKPNLGNGRFGATHVV